MRDLHNYLWMVNLSSFSGLGLDRVRALSCGPSFGVGPAQARVTEGLLLLCLGLLGLGLSVTGPSRL